MFFQRICFVLWILGDIAGSMSEDEYDMNCAENYDNEIPLDQQQESPSLGPCQDDAPRWDKLFTALEDSHMRQNMLLSSVEQSCGGGSTPLKMLWDKLTKGGCHICASSMEKTCKTLAEQTNIKIHGEFVEIMNYNAEMERNFNLTLQMILSQIQETNSRLKRLEDGPKVPPRPTVVAKVHGAATTASKSELKENQGGSVGEALVSIATELQKIQLQLNEVIKEARNEGRGDT